MVLCSTTGGCGGSRMSRRSRLDADEPAADADAEVVRGGFVIASLVVDRRRALVRRRPAAGLGAASWRLGVAAGLGVTEARGAPVAWRGGAWDGSGGGANQRAE